ncbi:hypothetical protein [Lentzea sp. CA-135723]|uniref:hypothetical protein n=1 Tax=Lentzea sp. CA-135723 TaxID=3239950 RepID=UPI003D8DC4C5
MKRERVGVLERGGAAARRAQAEAQGCGEAWGRAADRGVTVRVAGLGGVVPKLAPALHRFRHHEAADRPLADAAGLACAGVVERGGER